MNKKNFWIVILLVASLLPVLYSIAQRDFMMLYFSVNILVLCVSVLLFFLLFKFCLKKPKIGLIVLVCASVCTCVVLLFKDSIYEKVGSRHISKAIEAEILQAQENVSFQKRNNINLDGYTTEKFLVDFPECCNHVTTRYKFGSGITSNVYLDYLEKERVKYSVSFFGRERYSFPN